MTGAAWHDVALPIDTAILKPGGAMHAAIVPSPQGPLFYWNVDQAVGKNGANRFDDVLFVKWCFYKLAKYPGTVADVRSAVDRMILNEDCSGRDGDPLVEAIKVLQRSYNHPLVDGRVSPVPASGGTYRHGGTSNVFLIIYPLNAILQKMHPEQFPRIDLMPEFVWRIKDKATAPFAW
jgi:hypothetical protein